MTLRGIRGATTIVRDDKDLVLTATQELLETMQSANGFIAEDIASILFTATPDVCSAFPAQAARSLGWDLVPLLSFQEIAVPGALPRCIRVLIHLNTDQAQNEIQHVYLGEARSLRPDLGNQAILP